MALDDKIHTCTNNLDELYNEKNRITEIIKDKEYEYKKLIIPLGIGIIGLTELAYRSLTGTSFLEIYHRTEAEIEGIAKSTDFVMAILGPLYTTSAVLSALILKSEIKDWNKDYKNIETQINEEKTINQN
jgi:hypothetical protein